jgi:hypothetical protein
VKVSHEIGVVGSGGDVIELLGKGQFSALRKIVPEIPLMPIIKAGVETVIVSTRYLLSLFEVRFHIEIQLIQSKG